MIIYNKDTPHTAIHMSDKLKDIGLEKKLVFDQEKAHNLCEIDSPQIGGYYMATLNKSSEVRLTPRERQVVQLLSEDKTIKQIALNLRVSPKAVDSNRREAMNKLGIFSIAELTKFAIREGLTSSEF